MNGAGVDAIRIGVNGLHDDVGARRQNCAVFRNDLLDDWTGVSGSRLHAAGQRKAGDE